MDAVIDTATAVKIENFLTGTPPSRNFLPKTCELGVCKIESAAYSRIISMIAIGGIACACDANRLSFPCCFLVCFFNIGQTWHWIPACIFVAQTRCQVNCLSHLFSVEPGYFSSNEKSRLVLSLGQASPLTSMCGYTKKFWGPAADGGTNTISRPVEKATRSGGR